MTSTPFDVRRGEPVDPAALRGVCGSFATGVTVVTSGPPGRLVGTTVNSFTSVSLQPPLVLFCLHLRSRLFPVVRQAGGFAVNILGREQEALAWAFSGLGGGVPPEVPHHTYAGLPVLSEGLAFLACQLVREYDGGDHGILLGEVIELGASPGGGGPLVFYRGAMRPLDDEPPLRPRG
jgi:3-hydroxy-9,10-secoandrosta-1,3,5(10)-triene-9,17-dione monooxygenase reductase component